MKIAIYSGTIPSTTFVERLIEGVAINHEVFIFGVQSKIKIHTSNHVKIYSTSRNLLINLIKTTWHVFILFITKPKRLFIILNELQKYKTLYSKWHMFTRLIPIVRFLPDIFHVQWAKDLDRFMFLKEKLRVNLILSLRGAHINYSPITIPELAESYKNNFPKVDAFHAVSNAIAKEAQKYNADINKIKVVHSPITESVFKHYNSYRKSKDKTIKLCTVGRFHWKKGYKYLLDACMILEEQNIDYELTIIASNAVPEDILFQLDQLQIKKKVKILSTLKQEDLFSFIKKLDMLVLPSLEEGIANVVLEAMAIGLPVISTDCGGMAEVVKPNKTGWIIPTRNPNAIAKAIIEVNKTSEKELQRITENAHQLVKAEFKAEDSIRKFVALYNSVLHLDN